MNDDTPVVVFPYTQYFDTLKILTQATIHISEHGHNKIQEDPLGAVY